MKANANNVLKVLILGVAILVTGGEVFAASGTGGFGGKRTTVSCPCIGGWGMTEAEIGSTTGLTLGHKVGVGDTSPSQDGSESGLGGSVITGGGNDGGELGSTGAPGQVGNPEDGGTFTG